MAFEKLCAICSSRIEHNDQSIYLNKMVDNELSKLISLNHSEAHAECFDKFISMGDGYGQYKLFK